MWHEMEAKPVAQIRRNGSLTYRTRAPKKTKLKACVFVCTAKRKPYKRKMGWMVNGVSVLQLWTETMSKRTKGKNYENLHDVAQRNKYKRFPCSSCLYALYCIHILLFIFVSCFLLSHIFPFSFALLFVVLFWCFVCLQRSQS